MYVHYIALLIFAILIPISVCDPDKEYKVGEPQYKLEAAGGGNSRKNWEGQFNAGIGTKVWESKDKKQSLEAGVSYGRGYMGVDGTTYKGPKNYGAGMTFRWGRKKRSANI